MSGNYKKRDGYCYSFRPIDEYDESLLACNFDAQVDADIFEIEKILKEEKLLRNMCLVKLALFPAMYPLTYFLLGKVLAKDVSICNKIYWKYYRKKLTTEEFKRELADALKKAKQLIKG